MQPENPSTDSDEAAADAAGSVDVELNDAWSTVDTMVDGFINMLPKLVIAVCVFLVFMAVAWGVRALIKRFTTSYSSANVGVVLGRLAQWAILFIGLMVAVAIVAPSVTPAKLLSTLGVGGVAIGFAFKDILQNFMAGLLILLRRPFEEGDQVVFGDHEGTVESIETRATLIRTYDGRRIVIPNGQVYTNAMEVLTAYDHRRSQYDVGIGYADDIGQACSSILAAMQKVDGVAPKPAPDVIVQELAGSTVNLRARWWTKPERADIVDVHSRVIQAIKQRLDQDAIDMPYPTQVLLLHDQTESIDGDRTRQREGWPAGDSPPAPRQPADDSSEPETRANRLPGQ